jgi:hypothetical protein
MKDLLVLSLCLLAGGALAGEADTPAPEPLYRNGGHFGPESSDACPPHVPSATLKSALENISQPAQAEPRSSEVRKQAAR